MKYYLAVLLGLAIAAAIGWYGLHVQPDGAQDAKLTDTASAVKNFGNALDTVCTPNVVIQREGAGPNGAIFTDAIQDPVALVQETGYRVCRTLYHNASEVRAVKKITLILRDDPTVAANTTADSNDTIIVMSTAYLAKFKTAGGNVSREIEGILNHEMTHVYQNDDKAPGEGMYARLSNVTEGIADFVRIRNGFTPQGSEPSKSGTWDDEGYWKPAWFLLYIDNKYPGFIYRLNQSMIAGDGKSWTPQSFQDITGKTVEQLWDEYVASPNCTYSDKSACS